MKSISTFLLFAGKQHGKAEEAMNFYISLFPGSGIVSMEKYGKNEAEQEGTVKVAKFNLNGQPFMAIDSAAPHPFTFTPAISLFVELDTEQEIDEVYQKLVEGGMALMGLGAYPFAKKFAWVQDRYGVSWQLRIQ